MIDAIGDALQLDEAEREHLYDLARTAGTSARKRRRPDDGGGPARDPRILESLTDAPAFVRNGRLDVLAANPLGRALFAPAFAMDCRQTNFFARFNFLAPAARTFYPDWNHSANTTVALLRTEAGRDPYNHKLTELVGELSTRSEEFRVRWAATTCGCTTPASSTSGTRRSAYWSCGSRRCRYPPIPGSR